MLDSSQQRHRTLPNSLRFLTREDLRLLTANSETPVIWGEETPTGRIHRSFLASSGKGVGGEKGTIIHETRAEVGSCRCLWILAKRMVELAGTTPFISRPQTSLLSANSNLTLLAQSTVGMHSTGEISW